MLMLMLMTAVQVPGWEVGKSNSATGRWIPPPAPFGIDDPILK
jgi:hypothetical protein